MPGEETQKSIYGDSKSFEGKRIEPEAVPTPNIGIDPDNDIYTVLRNAATNGIIDMGSINNFLQVSQSRDQIYSLLDTMCEDSTIAAVLETYAEDATERNDSGKIVWVEAAEGRVSSYVQFLLDSMRVDKHIYRWVHSLCKYGDLYLRLYRKSEDNDTVEEEQQKHLLTEDVDSNKKLQEDIKLRAYKKGDHYSGYVEMVDNPATIFDLTQRGRSCAYIQTTINPTSFQTTGYASNASSPFYRYKFSKNDVYIYGATDFVHACLEDNTPRTPEEVSLFLNQEDYDGDINGSSYRVNRGQSLLYNIFKIWRELTLLENSVLLNRLTKSAVTRIVGVEVGDMPKEMVGPHLQGIKQLIEQKSAINTGKSLNEYTNPGPIENDIYVPTKNGVGAISTQTIGGDVNVGDLVDLDYFQDKLFGGLRVPKMYFGVTDDGAGFNGGTSLSIISSRYAKMIKRIQNTICQMLTDAINLMLIDRNMDSYVGQFTIKMLPPTTQEDIDRRDNTTNKIGMIGDVMNQLNDVEDVTIKLNILKTLLAPVINNPDVIEQLQKAIDELEKAKTAGENTAETSSEGTDNFGGEDILAGSGGDSGTSYESDNSDFAADFGSEEEEVTNEESGTEGSSSEESLPSPEELNIGDVSDATNPEI